MHVFVYEVVDSMAYYRKSDIIIPYNGSRATTV